MNRLPLRIGAAPLVAALLLALSACQPAADTGWSGYAEGDYVYVAAPVAGTLAALPVAAGQPVASGALLFALDDVPARQASAEAVARQSVAQAQADNTAKGRRADEIAMTRAQLVQARAVAERADAEWQRQQTLVAQDFISRSRLDDARSAAVQARARVAELEAALRVAELPARPDEQRAARAGADAAGEVTAQARWRLQQTRQQAPLAAQVADTFYRVGEYVPAGQPVLSLLPPGGRKLRFYVPEAERGALSPGQAVQVRCDGCGAPIAATISRIATQPEYTPPVIYSNSQRARLVFRVEALPAPADAARLPPGQPVDVHRVAP